MILVTVAPYLAHPDHPDPRGLALATLVAGALARDPRFVWWERDATDALLADVDPAIAIARFLLDRPDIRLVLHIGFSGPSGEASIVVPSVDRGRSDRLRSPYEAGSHPHDTWVRNTYDRAAAEAIRQALGTAFPALPWRRGQRGLGLLMEQETAWGRGRVGIDGFPPSRLPLMAVTCPLRDRLARLALDLGGHRHPVMQVADAAERVATALRSACDLIHAGQVAASRERRWRAKPQPPRLHRGQPYPHRTDAGLCFLPIRPRFWRAARPAKRHQYPHPQAPSAGPSYRPGAVAYFVYVTASPDGTLWFVSRSGHYCRVEDFLVDPETFLSQPHRYQNRETAYRTTILDVRRRQREAGNDR